MTGSIPAHLRSVLGPLDPAERQALRHICNSADVLVVEGRTFLLAPITGALLDTLAAFEAAEMEDDDPEFDPNEDREEELYLRG